MSSLKETISLDIEDSHEMLFRVKVEGVDNSPAKVRMVCEGTNGVSYMFDGQTDKSAGDDVISFAIPQMSGKLQEGTYSSKVEVLVDGRYFAPVEFNVQFKKQVKVVAESLQVLQRQPTSKEIKVTASQIANRPEKKSVTLRERFAARKQEK